MLLEELLDIDLFNDHIINGTIEGRRHPVLPLTVYCYTREVKYGVIWDDVTEKCRGLIVDDNGVVVSRPYSKSFNIETSYRPETHVDNLPKDVQPTFLDKIDGSFGVYYEYRPFGTSDPAGTIVRGIATKGSFTSEQAKFATEWYHEKDAEVGKEGMRWPEGYTPVFEILCEHIQKHPVSYEEHPPQLVLLGLVDIETGEEMLYSEVRLWAQRNEMAVVENYPSLTLSDAIRADRENKEGFVASYRIPGKPPLKLKIKHATFLRHQAIFHAATPSKILDALKANDHETLDVWEEMLEDERSNFVNMWRTDFNGAYLYNLTMASNLVKKALSTGGTRKEMAEFFLSPTNKRLASLCFAILDGRYDGTNNIVNVRKAGWKLVEEAYENDLHKALA